MRCRYCRNNNMIGAKRCAYCGKMMNSGYYENDRGRERNDPRGLVGVIVGGALVLFLLIAILVALPTISGREAPSLNRDDEYYETPVTLWEEKEPEAFLPEETTSPAFTEPEETLPKPAEDVDVYKGFSISSYRELKDILAPNCISKPVDATFQYLGSEGKLNYEDVCHILGARAASVTELGDGTYRITAQPYAGARILAAYRNGTTDRLTPDEQEALRIAESVVDRARKEANSDLELELLLHDWMCENISYYNVDFSIEFTEKRPLNVIGALLDGKANCQGYTDCFYLLGNMAGFVVDKQSEPTHTFNTIKLGGQWYVVDVTHDDAEMDINGELFHYYQFFNVGHADSDGRSWTPWTERNPVSETSGSYFYYEHQDLDPAHPYQKIFYSLQDAAKSILAEYKAGRTRQHILVRGVTADYETMNAALNQEANRLGIPYSVWTYYFDGVGNTYFFLYFE